MNILQTICFFFLGALLVAAALPPVTESVLKKLSTDGKLYVDEEMKRALFGVKQMKETMERHEEKHRYLMDSLRHSGDKRKGAMQLVREAEEKLEEAEHQCRDSLKISFDECRPCLEDACKTFYTSTCRRGFSSFSSKVEEFFRNFQLETPDQVYNQNEESPEETNSVEEGSQKFDVATDPALAQLEASFSHLQQNVSLLFNHSLAFVKRMKQMFGHSFLVAFTTEVKPEPLSPTQETPGMGFFGTMGLDHIFDSVYDLGRTVVHEFTLTVTDMLEETQEAEESQPSTGLWRASGQSQGRYLCRQLRRQVSECWQLQNQCEACEDSLVKECPSMRPLHSELEEIRVLLNASRQQYEERTQLVQEHTDNTLAWFHDMEDKYSWITQLPSSLQNVFNVTTVIPHQQTTGTISKVDTSVVVIILDSAPLTLSVPAELGMEDPAFIQYVAQEALTLHKQKIRGIK